MSKNVHDDADVDDLDDLDDIVDEFDDTPAPATLSPAPVPTSSSQPQQTVPPTSTQATSAPTVPPTSSDPPDGVANPEGAIDLEDLDGIVERMAKLLRELEGEGVGGVGDNGPDPTGPAPASSSDADDPFQRSIRQAMDRLRTSEANPVMSAPPPPSNDPLEELLRQFGDALEEGVAGGLGGGEAGGEGGEDEDGELQGMLETMMQQLMRKDVLYEPLKELSEKFPEYLTAHASSLSTADRERYEQQQARVTQIVTMFEREDYKEEDSVMGAEVVRLMNEMQSFGTPPTEIMGSMPPGFDPGADGMPGLPEGCVVA